MWEHKQSTRRILAFPPSVLVALFTLFFFVSPALASDTSEPSTEGDRTVEEASSASEEDTLEEETAKEQETVHHDPDDDSELEDPVDDLSVAAERIDEHTPHAIGQIVVDARSEEPVRAELGDEERQLLMDAIQSAMAAEENEEYEEARQEYANAYEIYPHSNLLLSVTRTSHALGEKRTARTGYEVFLERQPDYENRPGIEERIEELDAAIEEEEIGEIDEVPVASDRSFSLPSAVGWGGVAAVVLGTTSMLAGGAISSSVEREFSELETAVDAGDREGSLQSAREIGKKQSRGKFFMYGGVTVLLTGATLVVLDYTVLDRPPLFGGGEASQTSSSRTPSVAVEQDRVLLQWRGSF